MMHYEALRQLSHDRCERLQREAEAERLAYRPAASGRSDGAGGWRCTPRAMRGRPKPMAEPTRPPRA
jgi:hypothetical protein